MRSIDLLFYSMSVVINDINLEKKEMNSGEFMSFMLHRYEEIEDNLFGKILEKSDSSEVAAVKEFSAYCKKRKICK